MQDIVATLNAATMPDSEIDLSKFLISSQTKLTRNILNGETPESIFQFISTIFSFFAKQIRKEVPAVQTLMRRTACIFVMKMYPYFPDTLIAVLKSTMSDKDNIDPKSAALLIQVFTLIAETIDEFYLTEFLSELEAFPFLTQKDPVVFELVPELLPRLKNLGIEWHSQLLRAFLSSGIENSQYRAILAIIESFPSLVSILFENSPDLMLLAFIVSSLDIKLENDSLVEELMIGLRGLKSVGEIDTYLELLRSCGAKAEVEDTKVIFKYKSFECDVSLEIAEDHASFYRFDLPVEKLRPRSGDNVILLTSKFATLSRKTTDIQEVFHVFDEFLSVKYNENTTACLQYVPEIINRFGEIVSIAAFRRFLKKIVFCPVNSWFHAVDILTILRSLDLKHLPLLGGLTIVLERLFEFKMSSYSNESVTNSVICAIVALTTKDNCESVCWFLLKRIDFVSRKSLVFVMNVFSGIANAIGSCPIFTLIASEILETVVWYRDDIEFNDSLFRFLSCLDDFNSISPDLLSEPRKLAIANVLGVMQFYSGNLYSSYVSRVRVEIMVELLRTHVLSKEDVKIEFPNVVSALKVLEKLPDIESGFVLLTSNELLSIYPVEVTNFVMSRLPDLNVSTQANLMLGAVQYLKLNPIAMVASQWCLLFMSVPETRLASVIEELRPLFSEVKNFVFQRASTMPSECLGSFLLFDDGEEQTSFINMIPMEKRSAIATFIRSRNEELAAEVFDGEPIESSRQIEEVEIDSQFSFVSVTEADLQTPIKELDNPMLLTQLTRDTFEFSIERLQQLLRFHLNLFNEEMLIALIRYVLRHGISLETVLSCDLSETNFVAVLKSDPSVLRALDECGWDRDALKSVVDIRKEMENIMDMDRIKKKSLKKLLKALELGHDLTTNELINFCFVCARKLPKPVTMTIFILAISQATSEIQGEFVTGILQLLSAHIETFPASLTVTVIRELSMNVKDSQEIIDCLIQMLADERFDGCEKLRLLETAIRYGLDVPVPSFTSKEVNSTIPSLLNDYIRLSIAAVMSQAEKVSHEQSKLYLSQFFECVEMFDANPFVLIQFSGLVIEILKQPLLTKSKSFITKQYEMFLPQIDTPKFFALTGVLPELIRAMKPNTSQSNKVSEYAAALVAHVGAFELFIATTTATIDSEDFDQRDRISTVTDLLIKWCSKCCGADTYDLDRRIYEWSKVLMIYCGVDDTVLHLCYTISKYMPRLLPYLSAIMRFSRENPDINIAGPLEASSLLSHTRVHGEALKAAARKDFKLALKLASFDRDCPESDAILDKLCV